MGDCYTPLSPTPEPHKAVFSVPSFTHSTPVTASAPQPSSHTTDILMTLVLWPFSETKTHHSLGSYLCLRLVCLRRLQHTNLWFFCPRQRSGSANSNILDECLWSSHMLTQNDPLPPAPSISGMNDGATSRLALHSTQYDTDHPLTPHFTLLPPGRWKKAHFVRSGYPEEATPAICLCTSCLYTIFWVAYIVWVRIFWFYVLSVACQSAAGLQFTVREVTQNKVSGCLRGQSDIWFIFYNIFHKSYFFYNIFS